jgi:hypothetical protein
LIWGFRFVFVEVLFTYNCFSTLEIAFFSSVE